MATCPKGFFCIRNYNIIILLIILVILIILVYREAIRNFENKEPHVVKEQCEPKIIVIKEECKKDLEPPETKNYYLDRTPIQEHSCKGLPINVRTRGEVEYQQLGILNKQGIENSGQQVGNSSDTVILPLFGRQTYIGSNKYNYYTSTDSNNNIKIPININNINCTDDRGCDMINDGELINLPEFNGIFKCTLYNFDKPRYIPYI
tara:strand:+ start:1663 stop:2277 length:615 start_codon:yes stop_codon:yes gene_type:complete